MGGMIGQIKLTEAERELASKIVFDLDNVRLEYEQTIENGELAAALMESLMDRKAIPENRLRYFMDPDYNPRNSRSSRADIFLRNAGTVEEMYQDLDFVPFLRYFVFGADLPPVIKEAFAKARKDSFKQAQLIQLTRDLVRNSGLVRYPQNHKLNDAFYQLALDCGCEEWDARAVRDAVMRVK